jgi:Putative 2OG-Fe(II) oxygenase
MVNPALTLSAAFAVPFGEARMMPCAQLNRELEALFLLRENDQHRNPTPSHNPQSELFESRFNLFVWPEPCIRELRSFMMDAVARTVTDTTGLRAEDVARLTLHNHTWFHLTRYAGSFVAHNHPLASWSAVYCVRAGERVVDQPSSGVLRFFDPRQGANAFKDLASSMLRPPFAIGPLELQLDEGQVVVFPSYVFHEVAPFYGRDMRITVASNCWFG